MGVYINMEMPSCCMFCPLSNSCGCGLTNPPVLMTSKEMLADRPDWCPLIPVPPHGRLIDVDYADDYAYDELELANSYLTGWEAARAMQKIYQNAPVIIPASEEVE